MFPDPAGDGPFQPAEAMPYAVEAEGSVGDPGEGDPADPDPPDGDVEPGRGVGGEIRAVQPDPPLGVLGAPVVPDHPAPAVEYEFLPADLDSPSYRNIGIRGREFRTGDGRLIHPLTWQMPQRLGGPVVAQIPGGATQAPAQFARGLAGQV